MRPADDDIEARIRKLRIQATPEMRSRTLGDVLAAHEESQQTRPANSRPGMKGNRTMKTLKWLTPTAAAACIAIALFAWWATSGPPIAQTAYAELMQAVENSKTAEWAHATGVENGGDFEAWCSFEPLRVMRKDSDSFLCFNFGMQTAHQYVLSSNRILLTTMEPLPGYLGDAVKTRSFLNIMLAQIDQTKGKEGWAQVKRTQVTIDGKTYTLFVVENTEQGSSFTLRVDPEVHRIVRMTSDLEHYSVAADLDYPETGPEDIYALGAPRDAEIVDQRKPKD